MKYGQRTDQNNENEFSISVFIFLKSFPQHASSQVPHREAMIDKALCFHDCILFIFMTPVNNIFGRKYCSGFFFLLLTFTI